jgi:hypothetical protein
MRATSSPARYRPSVRTENILSQGKLKSASCTPPRAKCLSPVLQGSSCTPPSPHPILPSSQPQDRETSAVEGLDRRNGDYDSYSSALFLLIQRDSPPFTRNSLSLVTLAPRAVRFIPECRSLLVFFTLSPLGTVNMRTSENIVKCSVVHFASPAGALERARRS